MDESKYHTSLAASAWDSPTVSRIYQQVFRTSFEEPGVALVSFPDAVSSHALRVLMLELKQALSELHLPRTGKRLVYLSMGRFDSQVTTKFHLDGAPDEAFLMLGYEATSVHSELSIADYSRAAHEWNIEPRQLLTDFNPMFANHETRLRPYISKLTAFTPGQSQIVLLNNSAQPFVEGSHNLLGVMHQATITPNSQAQRIINSTLMSTAAGAADEPIGVDLQRQFVQTDETTGSM